MVLRKSAVTWDESASFLIAIIHLILYRIVVYTALPTAILYVLYTLRTRRQHAELTLFQFTVLSCTPFQTSSPDEQSVPIFWPPILECFVARDELAFATFTHA